MTQPAERFVAALAAKDTSTIEALFAPETLFRGMTPGRFWEATTPPEIVRDVLYQWFEPQDVIERVESVSTGRAGARDRVDYVFRVRTPDGLYDVEQRAYVDVGDDGRITRMHVMCSGFQPVAEQA